jgi:hypothetical protein
MEVLIDCCNILVLVCRILLPQFVISVIFEMEHIFRGGGVHWLDNLKFCI